MDNPHDEKHQPEAVQVGLKRVLKSRPRLRLRQQLMLSYLPLLLIPILIIGVVTRTAAERGLVVLVTEQGVRQANQLAVRLSNYYNLSQSWDGVNVIFDNPLPVNPVTQPLNTVPQNQQSDGGDSGSDDAGTDNQTNQRGKLGQQGQRGIGPPLTQPLAEQVILTDPTGVIIAANDPNILGRSLPPESVARGVQIFYQNQPVGVVVVSAALGVLDQAQQQLLRSVNLALLVAGVISTLATVVIGVWLSGQISAPIAALTRGVKRLAGGQWSQPIPVYSSNELGDLTLAFNQMADDLIRQQNLRKQLIADIAHDLRTPLSVMTLEIEGIKAGFQTSEEAAQSLGEEVEWLSRLVSDLHTLSLIDAGQLAVQPEPTRLDVFLDSIYRHWCNAAGQQGRSFRLEVEPDLPVVSIDPPRMRQVLGNLINNAMLHTTPEASITLRAQTLAQQVMIQIIDTGQGIPAEALPHLFERFFRVDRSRNRKLSGGSGLGLSIAYQLTVLQQGDLSVASAAGSGTTFTVTLPAGLNTDIERAEPQRQRSSSSLIMRKRDETTGTQRPA